MDEETIEEVDGEGYASAGPYDDDEKGRWKVFTKISAGGYSGTVTVTAELTQLDADLLMGRLRDGIYNEDGEPWWVQIGDMGMVPSDTVTAVVRLESSSIWGTTGRLTTGLAPTDLTFMVSP